MRRRTDVRDGWGARLPGRRSSDPAPRILLSPPDAYLGFLIKLGFPKATVVEHEGIDVPPDETIAATDVALIDLGTPSAPGILGASGGLKVIGIVDRNVASRTALPADLEGLLVRPFLPAELYRALRRALGQPEGTPGDPTGRVERLRSLLGPARVAAVALAAVLELASPDVSPENGAILAGAFLYSALRLRDRRRSSRTLWADVIVATGLLALTGGMTSGYIGFGLVVAAGLGLGVGAGPGLVAGVLIAAGSAYPISQSLTTGSVGPEQIVLWVVTFPVAALAGALTTRMWPARQAPRMLAEANEVLSTLYRIARAVPGGLELGSVASAAMDEVRETLNAPAGALLVGEADVLAITASFGLSPEGQPVVSRDAIEDADLFEGGARVIGGLALPAVLEPDRYACWLSAPLRHEGVTLGVLLAACADHSKHDENRLFLQHLADETAVAVENARLYTRVGQLSADEERRRLARELHDGVAQALAHVRFELEFLARHGAPSEEAGRTEVARLARVTERALADVRSTIAGLRSTVSGGGLGDALRFYLRDLRGLAGPEINFTKRGNIHLAADVEVELFRIVQEAVSNALRHGHARRIQVSLDAIGSEARLMIEDDGAGFVVEEARRGLGLQTMRDRAHQIGAHIRIRSRPREGTDVEVTLGTPSTDTLDPNPEEVATA